MEKHCIGLVTADDLLTADCLLTFASSTVFLFYHHEQLRDKLLDSGYMNFVVQRMASNDVLGISQEQIRKTKLDLRQSDLGMGIAGGVVAIRSDEGQLVTNAFSGIESRFETHTYRLIAQFPLK